MILYRCGWRMCSLLNYSEKIAKLSGSILCHITICFRENILVRKTKYTDKTMIVQCGTSYKSVLYMKAGCRQQASGEGNRRRCDGSFGTTIALVSTAAITNCHKLSGLKQQSPLNYKSVRGMAQLVPSSRSHRAEITVSAGLHSLQEALGNESSSRLIKVFGRI